MLDTFDRADTAPGTIGGPDVGVHWTITGEGIGDAQIVDGRFVTRPDSTTYIYQSFPRRPLRIGGQVSWVPGAGAGPGFGALISSKDINLIENMVHFIFSDKSWTLHLREDAGDFEVIDTGAYDVSVDGVAHAVEMKIVDSTVTLLLPDGTTRIITDPRVDGLSGPYCTWEIRNEDANSQIRWDEAEAWRASL